MSFEYLRVSGGEVGGGVDQNLCDWRIADAKRHVSTAQCSKQSRHGFTHSMFIP